MARRMNLLTVRQVDTLKGDGWHPDGAGLYLRQNGDSRRWIFVSNKGGKRRELGLGVSPEVSLAAARRLAQSARDALADGRDPFVERKVERADARAPLTSEPTDVTFGDFAESYIASVEAGWRNAVHRQQWRNSLRDHAGALNAIPIAEVGTDDVLAVLQPIWLLIPETASRVRGRIERILDAAKARGLRSRDSTNPAVLRGHLALLLPKQPKLSRGHHPALAFEAAPHFVLGLRSRTAMAARALEFTILTAARSGETLGARWREISYETATWTVPAERMKAGVEHVVPLSDAALAVLTKVRPATVDGDALIFQSRSRSRADSKAARGYPLSNMSMDMLLRRMAKGEDGKGKKSITVHGFRSTFRDWAGDGTTFPRELIEAALAHTIADKTERAYRRGTAIERRRALMEAWALFLAGETRVDAPAVG